MTSRLMSPRSLQAPLSPPLDTKKTWAPRVFTPIYSRIQATIQSHLKIHHIQQWSLNSDQEGSSEVPKLRIESKNQENGALEVVTRRTTRKTPVRPFLAQVSLVLVQCSLSSSLEFEEEILTIEVQDNEATLLSDEEITLDAPSQGTMASGSGGEEPEFDYDLTHYDIDD
ncbi:hypothetical protein Tco_1300865 [Tanacetum coccineum]